MSSNDHTHELLDDYIWYYSNGYAITHEHKGETRTTVAMHRKIMNLDDYHSKIKYLLII
jgi:hypothetical protein